MSAPTAATVASGESIVAIVGAPSITKASLEHWVSVVAGFEVLGSRVNGKPVPKPTVPVPPDYTACIARLAPSTPTAQRSGLKAKCEAEYVKLETKALGFLITSDWVRGEAAHLHLAVTHEEDKQRLDELRSKYSRAKLKSVMASSGETMSDLLWRIEGELLQSRVSEAATKSRTKTTEEKIALSEFQEAFDAHWKRLTNCRAGYVVEDCMQFKSLPTASTPQQHAQIKEERVYHEELREKKEDEKEGEENSKKFAKGESVSNQIRHPVMPSRQRLNGETYNTLGGMNLTSPAFEINGQIPVEYTCDGKGISPPLHWARVPSEAKSLLLYVNDLTQDSFTDPNGGTRWMVANINPENTNELAAGQVPEGAVVGKGNDGKTDYGPVCPERGKTDTIEFLVYAFKKPLDVKPGFSEQEVQEQYTANGNKIISGSSTTYYGLYTRP